MNYDELLAPAAKAMRPSGIRKFFDLAADMPHCICLLYTSRLDLAAKPCALHDGTGKVVPAANAVAGAVVDAVIVADSQLENVRCV